MEKHKKTIERVIRRLESEGRSRLDPTKVMNASIPEDDPDRIMNENDFSPIGSGEEREVYELPDSEKVVKIDLVDQEQNMNEVERWEKAEQDPEIKENEVLTPIVQYDEEYKWVIYEKVDVISLTDDDWSKIDDQTDYDLLEKIGVEDIDTVEFGWYDDNIVAYDYGC